MEKGLAELCLAWDSFWQAILDRKMSWLFVFYPQRCETDSSYLRILSIIQQQFWWRQWSDLLPILLSNKLGTASHRFRMESWQPHWFTPEKILKKQMESCNLPCVSMMNSKVVVLGYIWIKECRPWRNNNNNNEQHIWDLSNWCRKNLIDQEGTYKNDRH